MLDLDPDAGTRDRTQNSGPELGNQVGRIRLPLMGDN